MQCIHVNFCAIHDGKPTRLTIKGEEKIRSCKQDSFSALVDSFAREPPPV